MADEDIGSLAVRLALDDSSFQQGLQNLKRNMSVIDSSFKASVAGIKDWGKNLDSMKNNAAALGEKIGMQKQILQTYSEHLDKSKKSLQDNAKSMLDLKGKVDEAKTAWQEAVVAEGKDAEKTQELKKAYEDLNKQYTDAETKVKNNQKSIDGYSIQVNNATAKLKGMESQLSNLNKQIEIQSSKWTLAGASLTKMSEQTKKIGEGFTSIGETITTRVSAPMAIGLGVASKSAGDFEHQMADVRKELVASGDSTQIVNATMKKMSADSLKWGADFGQSTDDINAGLLILKKDGYSGQEAISDMSTALYTARGANEDLKGVIDTLGGSLEAYGMKTENAAENTKNMAHIADTFAFIANHTKASVISLGESFSISGQTLSAMHQPLEVTAAAIGELASSNIDASTAANALKAGFVNLTKPTDQMSEAIKKMNLQVFDSKGNMKELPDIIDNIKKGTKGWTEEQKNAAIATIFGKESLASWNALINKGGDNLRELSNGAKNSTGEVKRLSDSMKDTPVNTYKELQGSLKALGVSIGEDVLPTLIPLVKEATGAVKSFSQLDDGTKKMIVTAGEIVAIGGPILLMTGKVITTISTIQKGIGGLLIWIGKKTAANIVDAASTAANTVATNINTEAQSANAKARGESAVSEGISTAAKAASTAAEAENTAATVANTAVQGKNATGLLGTAKNFLGLGTAAGTAGEAIAGTGAAAAEAGEAATGMGAAAVGAGVSLGAVAVAAAGVTIAGYGIYKAYKMVTDQTVPQIDLFANSVVSTSTKVKAQNGTVATQIKDTTVSISNSTKQAISSYMDMDKKVSKSMQDIYVNSNNFSKQEKSTVISAYTDMANKVTSLTGSNKNVVLNNFKQMVSNTTTLTKQSRAEIVKEYSTMVNQVSGLTAQQKQKTIKDFSDSLTQASGITKSQANGIINQFKQMGDKINSAIDKTDQEQIKKVQSLFSKTTTISNQEQTDILNKMKHSDSSKKAEAEIYEKQISDIYTKASDKHRNLTQQEEDTVNDIRQRMQALAVQKMSANETEQKVIMQRIKDYNGQMTLQQASDTIQNAEKQRKGAVDAADKQYNETLATIYQMRDGTHTITADQADKMIAEAKRQHKQSVDEADGQKKEIVEKVQQMNSNVEKELDTSTGKQLSTFQKFSRDVSSVFSSIGSWFDNLMAKIGGTHTININTVMSGEKGFTSSAASTLSNLHGLRFNAAGGIFNQATQVTLGGNPNNVVGEGQYSEAVIPLSNNVLAGIGEGIVKATTELKNNKLSVEFEDNSNKSVKFGENTIKNITAGMKNKLTLLSSATDDMSETIKDGLAKENYADVMNKKFTDNLSASDNSNVLSNKAIEISSNLENAVASENQFSAQIINAIGHTENYDSAMTKLNHSTDMLSISTGNSEKDLRNLLGQMTLVSSMANLADQQYLKLGNSVGWSDDKAKEALKSFYDYQKQYEELGQKVVDAEQKIKDNQYNQFYNDIDADVKKLTADTDNLSEKLNNQYKALDELQLKGMDLDTQYKELVATYGQFSDQAKEAAKAVNDNNHAIQDLVKNVQETNKKMEDISISDWNSLFDKLKTALKDYYDDTEKQEESYWQVKIDSNSKWKDDTLSSLESIYNAKKSEIEKEKTLIDRQDSNEDDQEKIDADKKILSMNYSTKKKQEAQKDLDNILKEMNRRHQKESLDDQEKSLEDKYNSDKDNIEKITKTNEDYYNSQIASIKNFYANKEKEASLDAEAQKLIVSNNQNEIVKLLKSYGQDYELAGASLGERLVDGFKSKFSAEEIMQSVQLQIKDIVAKVNNMSTSVQAATNYNSIKNYSTNYNSSYGNLFHADKLVLNNNQDTKILMEEIQRLADIQKMSRGVR